MANMNTERIEEGVLNSQTHLSVLSNGNPKKSLINKWGLLLLCCIFSAVGNIGGPILLRLYFVHGGTRKWFSAWLETAGFPILLIPLTILYLYEHKPAVKFFASSKLLLCSSIIGLFVGVINFMYSHGLSFLPVSTSSLILSTQLIFTVVFACILVKQQITPYSTNAVVVMTLGSIMLGIGGSDDPPSGVTDADYVLGFMLTFGVSALGGLILPCTQAAYAKACKDITYPIVLQFQFCMACFATVFCSIGMLVNKDVSAIPREASEFELGATKYYLILVLSAVVWQMFYAGMLGLIFCASSLVAGLVNAILLPLTEIAAVILFQEKFTGQKGVALALSLWGFISYLFGAYKERTKEQTTPNERTESAE